MRKKTILAAISVVLSLSTVGPMPLHPDLRQRLEEENRLGEVLEAHMRATTKGVDKPNPYAPRWDLSKSAVEQPCLVLLVDFDDNQGATSPDHFDRMLFSVDVYGTGSMVDYYLENSYDELLITGQVLGWFRVPHSYGYYTAGDYGFGDYPRNAQGLVEDAVEAADSLVDFSLYDADQDGYVDCLFVVHAGPGAEQTGSVNDIWSHAWGVGPISVDGVLIWSYSMEPENGNIGVFSHELGHVLGLPDLYDYDYDSGGVGYWSVMASGSWGGGGTTPVHFDAWCKYRLGFLDPIIVTTFEPDATIPQVETDPVVYRLWSDGIPSTQYFLAENRRRVGFDLSIPGDGLVVFHVDETVGNNDDQTHYKVAVEQADGRYDLEANRNSGDSGDPFPGDTENRRFDAFTTPDSRAYDGHDTEVQIWEISDPGSLMTANFAVAGVKMSVESFEVVDSLGNGDGRGDPGETLEVVVSLKNRGSLDADSVLMVLSTLDPILSFVEDSSKLGAIPSGDMGDNSIQPFTIMVDPTATPHVATLYLDIYVQAYEYSKRDSIFLMIGRSDLLIVDDDDGADCEKYYFRALDELGETYEWSDLLALSPCKELHNYETVIWFTGNDRTSTLTEEDIDSLTTYLENGGRLFITGQNIGYDIAGRSFYRDYLHAQFVQDHQDEYWVIGVDGDPIGDGLIISVHGGSGACNQDSRDVVRPIGGADSTFYYWYVGGSCGVRYAGVYRLVYLSFGFEGISESEDRTEVMGRVLDWLNGFTDVEESSLWQEQTVRVRFVGAEPNPFMDETVIRYSNPSESRVSLEIYDLSGRLVRNLLDDEVAPGYHSAVWDGRDGAGQEVGSGVYFARLAVRPLADRSSMKEATEQVATTKLSVIR